MLEFAGRIGGINIHLELTYHPYCEVVEVFSAAAIPRFEVASTLPIRQQLKNLGIEALLNPSTCDISGIAGNPGDLYIAGIYHKTFVAIDEDGTEAAAATAAVGGTVSIAEPATFHANRPFIFAIFDEPTGEILFLGRVTDPS